MVSVAGSTLCLLAIAALQESTPLPLLVALVGLSGVFRSVGFTSFLSIAYADVEPGRMTHANTLLTTLQELSSGLGIAVGAVLVSLGGSLVDGLRDGRLDDSVDGPAGGFRFAFVVLAGVLLVPLAGAWRLHPAAGAQVTGPAPTLRR